MYTTNVRKYQPFVYVPPIAKPADESPINREKILDRLRRAVRICNFLMTGKRVPGFHPEDRSLIPQEIEQITAGLSDMSFMLNNLLKWPKIIDFEVECFCDCKTTVGCLQAIGIHTLWDIVNSKGDDYQGCLAIAEKVVGAERQYHMLALVEISEIDD